MRAVLVGAGAQEVLAVGGAGRPPLSGVGETSGADFCLGLSWAATAGRGAGHPWPLGLGQEASRR